MKTEAIALLSVSDFRTLFRPMVNLLRDDADHDGTLYGTFGIEHVHVLTTHAVSPGYVWTVRQTGAQLIAESGYHRNGAVGYFITGRKSVGPAQVMLDAGTVLAEAV